MNYYYCCDYDLIKKSVMPNFVTLSNFKTIGVWFTNIAFSCFQAGKGGELTHDETTIISGALDLTEKVNTKIHPPYIVECQPIY